MFPCDPATYNYAVALNSFDDVLRSCGEMNGFGSLIGSCLSRLRKHGAGAPLQMFCGRSRKADETE